MNGRYRRLRYEHCHPLLEAEIEIPMMELTKRLKHIQEQYNYYLPKSEISEETQPASSTEIKLIKIKLYNQFRTCSKKCIFNCHAHNVDS